MQVVPASQLSFEVTYDSAALIVGMSVYETTGVPSLAAGPLAMTSLVGNTYYAQFTPVAGKQYVVFKAVYSDAPMTTLDANYGQASESILCKSAGIVKNTAFTGLTFPMYDVNGAPKTGLAVTMKRSIDGGAVVPVTNAVAEVSLGIYSIDLSAADLNGRSISFACTAIGALETSFTVIP